MFSSNPLYHIFTLNTITQSLIFLIVCYINFFRVLEDKDLKVPIHNEAWLIRFLRPTKYYPESAYKLVRNGSLNLYSSFYFLLMVLFRWQIKQYYHFKVKHANIYNNLSPKTEKNIFDHDILHVLPKRDQCGRRILVIELGSKYFIFY